MKLYTIILLLLLKISAFGQSDNFVDYSKPDSLSTVKLDFEFLDSNSIKSLNPKIEKKYRNIATYDSQDGGKRLAYYTIDKNKWISFSLTFHNHENEFSLNGDNIIKLVNIDKKGQPELIIDGGDFSYGAGGNSGIGWLIIINIDSIPTQIFKVSYYCATESFGDTNNKNEYERKIDISESGIVIAPLKKLNDDMLFCELTNILSGTYHLTNGKIRRKE